MKGHASKEELEDICQITKPPILAVVPALSHFLMSHFLKGSCPFGCRDADVCALRRKYAYLFNFFSGDSSMKQPFLQQASAQDASDVLLQHNNKLF
eukprot:1149687-Pelagomonas_calceolata.AAC.1